MLKRPTGDFIHTATVVPDNVKKQQKNHFEQRLSTHHAELLTPSTHNPC
jgi:hypothetical protein